MRKIILGVAVSLDGFIEGPNGEYDWCFTDQDYGMKQFLNSVDAIFYGRKSYELMAKMEGGSGMDMFGKKKNYIFSTTLKTVPENYSLVSDSAEVDRIKKEDGKNIWLFGGANLTSSFLKQKLVDELWLAVHPIVLGRGKPLFEGVDERIMLELMDSQTYNTGLVSLNYRVKR
jgi:dihydrofolate reductase